MRELPQSETGDMPEAEAIRLAREGNADAFERLYRLHSRRVFTICFRMLENATPGKTHSANRFTFEAEPPGNPVDHPSVHSNKIVPFRRKRDLATGDLTSKIDHSPAEACAAVK